MQRRRSGGRGGLGGGMNRRAPLSAAAGLETARYLVLRCGKLARRPPPGSVVFPQRYCSGVNREKGEQPGCNGITAACSPALAKLSIATKWSKRRLKCVGFVCQTSVFKYRP